MSAPVKRSRAVLEMVAATLVGTLAAVLFMPLLIAGVERSAPADVVARGYLQCRGLMVSTSPSSLPYTELDGRIQERYQVKCLIEGRSTVILKQTDRRSPSQDTL